MKSFSALLSFAVIAIAASAHANDPAAAQALFDEGMRLGKENKIAAACDKFAASERLDPQLGTFYQLADCHERAGKLASAWGEFVALSERARLAGQQDRAEFARKRAEALAPKLARLTIVVSPAARSTPGLTLARGDVDVLAAQWDAALPIDPGSYDVVAKAPGKRPFIAHVTIAAGPSNARVEIPALVDAESGAPPSEGAIDPSRGSSQHLAGIVVAAAGVVGVGVGATFGLMANSAWKNAKGECRTPGDGNTYCTPAGVADANSASGRATASNVFFVVGGVAIAAGAVVYLTAPRARSAPTVGLAVAPGFASVVAKGSF